MVTMVMIRILYTCKYALMCTLVQLQLCNGCVHLWCPVPLSSKITALLTCSPSQWTGHKEVPRQVPRQCLQPGPGGWQIEGNWQPQVCPHPGLHVEGVCAGTVQLLVHGIRDLVPALDCSYHQVTKVLNKWQLCRLSQSKQEFARYWSERYQRCMCNMRSNSNKNKSDHASLYESLHKCFTAHL